MGFGVMAASAIKMLNDGTLQATAETKSTKVPYKAFKMLGKVL